MPTPRYVLIANPGTPRCETYRQEVSAYWAARGSKPDVELVPWAEIVSRDGDLNDLPFGRPAIVRLESPGKDARVTRLLLEAGARDDPTEPQRDWRSVPMPKGLLLRPALVQRGFRRVLQGLRRGFDARPHLAPTACPLAIAQMFDKTATAFELERAGIPIPDMLNFHPTDYSTAREAVVTCGWPTAYVKLNTGSSASGVVVLNLHAAEPFGITSLALVGDAYRNSRFLRRVTGPDLQRAVEFILAEEPFIQCGIPMAQIDGQNFDVRVVCLYGRPVASIFRLSSAPMTNLHIGGRRGEFKHCRSVIPGRAWLDALDHCVAAAGRFDSAVAGVDLVFERGYRRHYVLEVNAFGDFFPGWTDARGRSIHAREIEATAERSG